MYTKRNRTRQFLKLTQANVPVFEKAIFKADEFLFSVLTMNLSCDQSCIRHALKLI